jgi:hypothetical protein
MSAEIKRKEVQNKQWNANKTINYMYLFLFVLESLSLRTCNAVITNSIDLEFMFV